MAFGLEPGQFKGHSRPVVNFTADQKQTIKRQIIEALRDQPEIDRIVVFGSFVRSTESNDLDIAVFQHSHEHYLPLAIRYRMRIAHVAQRVPFDVFPVRPNPGESSFLAEIERGETIYER